MPKPAAKSTLYRLIEAGHLARQALVVPLIDRGLQPGDDAIVFAIRDAGTDGLQLAELQALTGLDAEALEARIRRLVEHRMLECTDGGPDLLPAARLTEKGERASAAISAYWAQTEDALLADLKPGERKTLRKQLKRFTELLKL